MPEAFGRVARFLPGKNEPPRRCAALEATTSTAGHAVGELLTCPFCVAQWVGTASAAGLVFAPEATRLTGATLTAIAGSDWLQLGYARLQRSASSHAERAGDPPSA